MMRRAGGRLEARVWAAWPSLNREKLRIRFYRTSSSWLDPTTGDSPSPTMGEGEAKDRITLLCSDLSFCTALFAACKSNISRPPCIVYRTSAVLLIPLLPELVMWASHSLLSFNGSTLSPNPKLFDLLYLWHLCSLQCWRMLRSTLSQGGLSLCAS